MYASLPQIYTNVGLKLQVKECSCIILRSKVITFWLSWFAKNSSMCYQVIEISTWQNPTYPLAQKRGYIHTDGTKWMINSWRKVRIRGMLHKDGARAERQSQNLSVAPSFSHENFLGTVSSKQSYNSQNINQLQHNPKQEGIECMYVSILLFRPYSEIQWINLPCLLSGLSSLYAKQCEHSESF